MLRLAAASILAAALLMAGHLIGGRYVLASGSVGASRTEVYRLDRFTGQIHYCTLGMCEEADIGSSARAD